MATNSKKTSVPEAKEAMNRFKEEVASELGVPLKEGYNGDLTSKQAGSIGGDDHETGTADEVASYATKICAFMRITNEQYVYKAYCSFYLATFYLVVLFSLLINLKVIYILSEFSC